MRPKINSEETKKVFWDNNYDKSWYSKGRRLLKVSDKADFVPDDMASEMKAINDDDIYRSFDWFKFIVIAVIVLLVAFFCTRAHAYTLKEAVRAVVGEASNQGYKGMVCVSEVIRHNVSLKPFYGFKASHAAHEPAWVWKMARKAYIASAKTNYTKGAQHFENIHAFGKPYWVKNCVKNCVKTYAWKDHVFYKERTSQ